MLLHLSSYLAMLLRSQASLHRLGVVTANRNRTCISNRWSNVASYLDTCIDFPDMERRGAYQSVEVVPREAGCAGPSGSLERMLLQR